MFVIAITSQGVLVHAELAGSAESATQQREALSLKYDLQSHKETFTIHPEDKKHVSLNVTRSHYWIGSKKNDVYALSVARVQRASETKSVESSWSFCPHCGCSWLNHLEVVPALGQSEWEIKDCGECGCSFGTIKP